ncbi:hypothetical protein RIF29_04968 [Crotalaria pallida]|uniref:Uncharacterized protein n=1 Tax=Crotalaria pallida TaxID=3830 RepID=A0AAN9J2Z7_CROPI
MPIIKKKFHYFACSDMFSKYNPLFPYKCLFSANFPSSCRAFVNPLCSFTFPTKFTVNLVRIVSLPNCLLIP